MDRAILSRYLRADLVDKVLGGGAAFTLEENLQTVGYLNDLANALTSYVPEHISRDPDLYSPAGGFLDPCFIEGTFLFADITGFTPLTEAMAKRGREGGEELTIVINSLFEKLLDIVTNEDGSVLKFGGDSILAYFPRSTGARHLRRGMGAAHEMKRAVSRFRKTAAGVPEIRLQMSIGIAAGKVYAGQVGDPSDRAEYVVAGEPLRRMAKAESAAASGQVFVDRASLAGDGKNVVLGEESGEFVELVDVPRAPDGDDEKTGFFRIAKPEIRLTATESTREKVEALLRAIERLRVLVPEPIFERLKASPDRIDLDPEHRQVTTLFVNLRGLDELVLASGEDARKIHEPLTRVFTEIHGLVQKHKGIISRVSPATMGDNLLILFGAPTSSGDDAKNAAQCAAGIRDRVAALAGSGGGPFTVRIGVNTGFAFCANVGSTLRKEYTVLGDPVNLAARLMTLAEDGAVVLGESTRTQLGGGFLVKELPPARVKGKKEPVANFLLARTQDFRPPQATTTQVRKKLLGRRKELQFFSRNAELAARGSGQVLVVLGEMGIGKSSLLKGAQTTSIRHGMRALSIGPGPQEVGSPNRPWIELLREILEIPRSDDPQALLAALKGGLEERFPDLSAWDVFIASYLGVELPGSEAAPEGLNARGRADQFKEIVSRVVEISSRSQPLALFLDNADGLDPASLRLLHELIERVESLPVLLVLAVRDASLFGMFFQLPHVHRLELEGIDIETARRLLESHLGVARLPEDLVRGLFDRCRGNPLLMGEMAGGLVHQGHLVVDAEKKSATLVHPLDQAGPSDQLHAYFISRLDRVSFHCRRVLTLSAVMGESFATKDLERLHRRLESSSLDFRHHAKEAVEEGILVEAEGGRFAFYHPLMKEVLYENIAFETRRHMHREMGKLLEEDFFPNLERGIDLLAHHFDRSDDHRRAVRYLVKAGDRAKQDYANSTAVEYYKKAIQRIRDHKLEDEQPLLPLLDRYSRALEHDGQIAKSIEVLKDCQRIARERAAHASSKIGRLYTRLGELDDAARYLEEAHRAYEEFQDSYGLGHALLNKGQLAQARGDAKEAARYLSRSFEALKTSGDQEGMARCLHSLSLSYKEAGDLLKAAEHLKASLGINEKIKSRLGQGICHKTLGEIYIELENFPSATRHLEFARAALEEVGDKYSLAGALLVQGRLASWQAALGAAQTAFERAAALHAEMGDQAGEATARLGLSRVLFRMGVRASAREEVELARRCPDPACQLETFLVEGEVWREEGDLDSARRCHKEALARARATGLPRLQCLAYLELSADLLVVSRFKESLAAVHQAFQLGRALEKRRLVILGAMGLGDVYARIGRPQKAVEFYRAAVEQAEQVGYTDLLPFLLASLGAAIAESGGSLQEALDAGKKAYELADKAAAPGARIEALLAISATLVAAGKLEQGRKRLELLLPEAEVFGSPLVTARCRLLSARAARAAGDRASARPDALAAIGAAKPLGCLWVLRPAYEVLAEAEPDSGEFRKALSESSDAFSDAARDVRD
ncbi:MAG: tetratricopeptide repeat protein [Planctomycetes bacterium]|nr:tetratricopeptide repeat protein [Planctomycetota bacterium]